MKILKEIDEKNKLIENIKKEELDNFKKIKEIKDSIKLNVWDIIDTYFRDNKYYKSKHQLDSYNEFITSKTNGLEYIIKRGNPLIIYKQPMGDNFRYEIKFYLVKHLMKMVILF